MKKVFRFEGLACPNCAKKLEEAVKKMDGVLSCGVNFITGKLTIEAEDAVFEAVVAAADKAGKAIKPAFTMKG